MNSENATANLLKLLKENKVMIVQHSQKHENKPSYHAQTNAEKAGGSWPLSKERLEKANNAKYLIVSEKGLLKEIYEITKRFKKCEDDKRGNRYRTEDLKDISQQYSDIIGANTNEKNVTNIIPRSYGRPRFN